MDYRNILVPHDFSACADAALDVAADLARRLGAELHMLHVMQVASYAYAAAYTPAPTIGSVPPPPVDLAATRDSMLLGLRDVAARLEPLRPRLHVLEGERVDRLIVETAEKILAHLIVMGTHGRTGLAHVFLGSIAERTLRAAPCPVLTVRVQEDARAR